MWRLVVATLVALAVMARLWVSARCAEREVVPTDHDVSHARGLVEVRALTGKGLGVVAVADIPKGTFVAPYPGVVRSRDQYEQLLQSGRVDDEYAAEFWESSPGGLIDESYIINPKLDGRFPARFQGVGPYFNEPSKGGKPSLHWVWNFPRRRLEFWTMRDVAAGEELTVCYGVGYTRGYTTGCSEKGVEPTRRAIGREGQRPRPWYSVVRKERAPRGGA